MDINDAEKLILVMLSEIIERLEIDTEVDPKFVKSVISSGNAWGLRSKYPGIFGAEETPESIVTEVGHFLDMWSFLERGYAALSEADRERVATEAEPFGNEVQFRGFDGNNEANHMGAAHFMVNDLDRFPEFAGRDLNSHHKLLDGYQRMYDVFDPILSTLADGQLSADEIIQILRARKISE